MLAKVNSPFNNTEIALSTIQKSTEAYSREVTNSLTVEEHTSFIILACPALWVSNTAYNVHLLCTEAIGPELYN